MIEQDIGKWNTIDGLRMYEENMWRRRVNLHGVVVRATCVNYPVMTPHVSYDTDGNIVDGNGFMIDLLHLLEKTVNMTFSISLSIDGKFGGRTENGSFDGMVGMLKRNETDVALLVTFTEERNQVIDFTKPIFPKDPVTLFAPLGKGEGLSYSGFVNVFSTNVWTMIAAFILILSIAFYMISTSKINHFHDASDPESFGFLNSLALSVNIAMQLSYDVIVKSTSARIIYLTGGIMAYILFTYYGSNLTAQLATVGGSIDIKNFQDVIDKKYKVMVAKSTSQHEILKNAKEGSAMHRVYYNSIHDYPDQFVESIADGVNKVWSREKTLYYAQEISIQSETHRLKILRIAVNEQRIFMYLYCC